jgi:hypothetical protein
MGQYGPTISNRIADYLVLHKPASTIPGGPADVVLIVQFLKRRSDGFSAGENQKRRLTFLTGPGRTLASDVSDIHHSSYRRFSAFPQRATKNALGFA